MPGEFVAHAFPTRWPLANWQTPLADVSHFWSLGRNFRRGGATDPVDAVAAVLVLAGIIAVVVIIHRTGGWISDRTANSNGQLFNELCKLHALQTPSRRLLKKMATALGVDPPARLFLEPEHFDEPNLPPDLAGERPRVAALRDRLFQNRDQVDHRAAP